MERKRFDKYLILFLISVCFYLLFCMHALAEEKDITPPKIKVEITDAEKEFTNKVRKATVIISDDKMKGEIKKEYVFKEGKDSFHISVKDAAGNESTYKSDTYIQDYTAPMERVVGIAEGQIINDELNVTIFAEDEWLDEEKSFAKIKGKNRHDEYVYYFEGNEINIFDEKGFADDYYTLNIYLEDKAGNVSEREIDFTINRKGSTFEVDEKNEKIIGSFTSEIKDFYITEKNLNEIESVRILFAYNARAIEINEGEEFQIEKKITPDGFIYSYFFYDDLFIKEGVYTISISTRDGAGNVNDTRLDPNTDEIRFAVKKGP